MSPGRSVKFWKIKKIVKKKLTEIVLIKINNFLKVNFHGKSKSDPKNYDSWTPSGAAIKIEILKLKKFSNFTKNYPVSQNCTKLFCVYVLCQMDNKQSFFHKNKKNLFVAIHKQKNNKLISIRNLYNLKENRKYSRNKTVCYWISY